MIFKEKEGTTLHRLQRYRMLAEKLGVKSDATVTFIQTKNGVIHADIVGTLLIGKLEATNEGCGVSDALKILERHPLSDGFGPSCATNELRSIVAKLLGLNHELLHWLENAEHVYGDVKKTIESLK